VRVALFVHCFFPEHFYGTETYTLELARNLKALGHEPTVVSAVFPGEARRGAMVTRYEHDGIPVVCIDKNEMPDRRIRDTYLRPEMKPVLAGIVRELRPDIAHVTHLINHTAALLEVLAEAGVPRVATFTDFFGFCYNNKLEAADGSVCAGPNRLRTNCMSCHLKALREQGREAEAESLALSGALKPWNVVYMQLKRRLSGEPGGVPADTVLDIRDRPGILRERYRKYAAGIASTKVIAESYRRNGIDVPIHRIPFGVDCDRSPRSPRPAGAPVTFGFIGQIAPHKGTDLLIDAFRTLPPGSARLLIHGPANQDPRYYARLEQSASGAAVEFRGTFPADEIQAKLAEIDVLVIPSRWYENSPLVLLYALATHTPVIVTDLEGLTEFMEEGRSGFAFPKEDVPALARAMRRFVDEPGLLATMSAQTRYDQDTRSMTEQVVRIYREVLELPCAA